MTFFSKKKYCFHKNELREIAGNVVNCGRGWYRIYTYVLGDLSGCSLPPVLYPEEALALVLIDIGSCRESDMGEESLVLIDEILQSFADGGKDIILRIAYDTEGKGMEREPSLFSQVLRHIEQLAPVLIRHSSHILVFQGQLVGSWGEMHTSKFLSEKYLQQLTETFLTQTQRKIRFAVRKPVQYRITQPEGSVEENLIGCFDDAIFASPTHLGTFGTQNRKDAGWRKSWLPDEEMAFMEELAGKVPFGGEALNGEEGITPSETVERLCRLHVSYLNCVHEQSRLQEWKDTLYRPDVSLYDYIEAHMGYRFVVEKVSCERKGKKICLSAKIANRGFACFAEEILFLLFIEEDDREREIPLNCDLGRLEAGKSLMLHIPLEEKGIQSGVRLYAGLKRVRDLKTVRFANEGAKERLFLGSFDP